MLGADVLHAIRQMLLHLSTAHRSILIGGIYLVERRGKPRSSVNPKRQVDLSTILHSIPEATLIIDKDRRIVDANSAAAELLGASREQLLGGDWGELSRALDAAGHDGKRPNAILERALKGIAVRSEHRLVHTREDRDVELLVSATPMRNEQGQVVAALVIARDVTELTALQRRIGDAERHLAIGQMAAALAHDFNNILTAIGQAAYILESGKATEEERRSYSGVIQNAVRRGAEIIARVREYIRSGRGALGSVDVRQLLQEAMELTRPLTTRGKVRVHSELKDLPLAYGNAADLRRVFTNIIINAIEAMPNGGDMTVSCYRDNNHVVATIADTGTGIAPENRSKVFFPYFTTKKAGTGLGLSGAQKLLLAQGGNIGFRTEMGKGTTFVISLPLAASKSDPGPRPQCHDRDVA